MERPLLLTRDVTLDNETGIVLPCCGNTEINPLPEDLFAATSGSTTNYNSTRKIKNNYDILTYHHYHHNKGAIEDRYYIYYKLAGVPGFAQDDLKKEEENGLC